MQTALLDGKQPIDPFESKPPEWVPPATRNGDLGYHGFHPPRPGQIEDILSEKNVRDGYLANSSVTAESFSGKEIVDQEMVKSGTLAALQDLMNQAFARRNELQAGIAAPTFKLPGRVTLNDAKRQAWVAELANPDIPLHKLGRTVPHGFKGQDLLDMLQTNKIAIPRAVWYVRVLGGNETHGMRNRQNFSPSLYSVEWATALTAYLKKQLSDIALPSAPRPGLNIKQIFKGVLGEPESRERWTSKFNYTLELLREFYSEGMVDRGTFLSWLSQQMGSLNMAQAAFVARIAEQYLDGLCAQRALMRVFLEGTLLKLSEINASSVKEYLSPLATNLVAILQRAFLARPDHFVNAKIWATHHNLLQEILREENAKGNAVHDGGFSTAYRGFDGQVREMLVDVEGRNEALLFKVLPSRPVNDIDWILLQIKLLNSISPSSDISSQSLLNAPSTAQDESFARKLDILLTWSTNPLQHGDHRPFLAASLLSKWSNGDGDESEDDDFEQTIPLQDLLVNWIARTPLEQDSVQLRATAVLFGQLIQQDLFSIGKYITRLIARGETDLSSPTGGTSRHLILLRQLPLIGCTPLLLKQRKLVLYGIRMRNVPEAETIGQIRRELRSALPEFFPGSPVFEPSPGGLRIALPVLLSAPPFEQFSAVTDWLSPIVRSYITEQSKSTSSMALLSLDSYVILMRILSWVNCYPLMLELNFLLLSLVASNELALAVLDTFRRHHDVWHAMDSLDDITMALFNACNPFRSRGFQMRPLLTLLAELDGGRRLSPELGLLVAEDMAIVRKAMTAPAFAIKEQVPSVIPEVAMLSQETNEDSLPDIASRLWLKYSWNPVWVLTIWANTVAVVRQVPSMMLSPQDRRLFAHHHSALLGHVAQYIPSTLDEPVRQWMAGPGRAELPAYEAESWHMLNGVIAGLVANGTLGCPTVVGGILYVAWELAASPTSQPLDVLIQSANALAEQLLEADDISDDPSSSSPANWSELQRLQTRRRIVYEPTCFPALVACLPLLIALEVNMQLSGETRESVTRLRRSISRNSHFRRATVRDIEVVHNAFVAAEGPTAAYKARLHQALRLILNDDLPGDITEASDLDSCNWTKISIDLDPWRLSRASIELRLTLQQLNDDFEHAERSTKAERDLEELSNGFFSHASTPGQNDLLAKAFRAVGGKATSKFALSGMDLVAKLVSGLRDTLDVQRLDTFLTTAGEVLRLMASILQPLNPGSQSPQFSAAKQLSFVTAFVPAFENIQKAALAIAEEAEFPDPKLNLQRITEVVIMFARILQFSLGIGGQWPSGEQGNAERLLLVLIRLITMYGQLDQSLPFTVLLDSLSYFLDGYTKDAKTLMMDLQKQYPELETETTAMITSYRSRLSAVIGCTDNEPYISNLVQAMRDASGALVAGAKVQNRPWEWTENIDSMETAHSPVVDNNDYKIRNSASIPLELFGARATGEMIVEEEAITQPNISWAFSDGIVTEGGLQREWRESRLEWNGGEGDISKIKTSPMGYETLAGDKMVIDSMADFMVGSPAASVLSRSSAIASSSSRRGSPIQQRTSVREVIDVDSVMSASSSTRGSKRKASSTAGDDDVIVLDGPTTRGGATRRGRGRATTSGKTTKRK